MKNSADLGECNAPRPSASVANTLLDLQNSSYPTQPHSIIAKYTMVLKEKRDCSTLSLQRCFVCVYIYIYIYILKTELRISDFQRFYWLAGHRLSAHIPALPNMVNERISK